MELTGKQAWHGAVGALLTQMQIFPTQQRQKNPMGN
jgi:hypothetical protein